MPNARDHAEQVGGQTLEERPFDELDSLILSQIVYMPMENLLDGGQEATLAKLGAFLRVAYPENFPKDPFQRKRCALTLTCAGLPRYSGWVLHHYLNCVDPERETQFAACCFDLPGDLGAIVFRGTDWSLAGMKEDLNMCFMTVPAQREAVEYVHRVAMASERALVLCGHSKGGNLAIYAGANADGAIQDRIHRIYSFDGPGVDEKTLHSPGYDLVRDRIRSYVPQSSVVGLLLYYHPVFTVVRSKSLGILQHDAMNWQVKDGGFVALDGLNLTGRVTDEAIHAWLSALDVSARKLLVDTLYQVVASAQTDTLTGLVEDWRDSAVKMLEALRGLDPQVRKSVRHMLASLFSTGGAQVIRSILPRSLQDPKP
ncbi:MAG: DUF2974 domain-containing protein [Clostridia bacterium]|nr:DUF2974 domain-containing protein [Clostridia bacterium]